jgi:hypothetical protein
MAFFKRTDDEFEHFRGLGYTGTINDMLFEFLGDVGYVGTLADRLHGYVTDVHGEYNRGLLAYRDGFPFNVTPTGPEDVFVGEEPAVFFDLASTARVFTDTAGITEVTTAGQSVALVLDRTLNATANAIQPLVTQQPTFQIDAGGMAFLQSDGIDDSLIVVVPDLGVEATIAFETELGTTILTDQTVGAGPVEVLRGNRTYGFIAMDRRPSFVEEYRMRGFLNSRRGE